MSDLTPRQKRFVDEYLVDLNATQAAIRAGYSEKGAYVRGSELLSIRKISDAVAQAKTKRANRVQVDSDYVLRRMIEIDQMSVADIIDDNGSVIPVKDWPDVWKSFISGFDVSDIFEYDDDGNKQLSGTLKKIKWPDKLRNLEMMGRHVDVKAFEESNVVVPGAINLVINRPSGD